MLFKVVKASDSRFKEQREIKTIEDLEALAHEHPGWHGKDDYIDVIVSFGRLNPMTITIYDDYIE